MTINRQELSKKIEQFINSKEYALLERNISQNNPRFNELPNRLKSASLYMFQLGIDNYIEDMWRFFYTRKIPTIKEYLTKNYIGLNSDFLFPKWRDELIEHFSPGNTRYELIVTGAIGTGKTSFTNIGHLYNLIRILSLKQPQIALGVAPMTLLVLQLFSTTLEKSALAVVAPFVNLMKDKEATIFEQVKNINYFNDYKGVGRIPFVDGGGTVLFPNNVMVMSGSRVTHALGISAFGASLDESEFRISGPEDAVETYNALKERVRSRFMGSRFIFLTMMSSAKSSIGIMSDYLKRIKPDDPHSKILAYPIWEVKYKYPYEKGHFWVMRGTQSHPHRILSEEECKLADEDKVKLPENCLLIKVPEGEYRKSFEADISRAIRDLAGIQELGGEYLFPDTSGIEYSFLTPELTLSISINDRTSVLNKIPSGIFVDFPGGKQFTRYPNALRYIHCFTKDTKIKLLNGTSKTFEELLEDQENSIQNWAYTWNSSKGWVPGRISRVFSTGMVGRIIRLTLDNNEVIKCTPNHRFMLRDGSYKEAQYLTPEDSLMPLYCYTDSAGYEVIKDNRNNELIYTHKISDTLLEKLDLVDADKFYVRHHKDFNKKNNNPDNLVFIGNKSHITLHSEHADKCGFASRWKTSEFTSLMSRVNSENGKINGKKNMLQNWHGENSEEWRKFISPIQSANGSAFLKRYNGSENHINSVKSAYKRGVYDNHLKEIQRLGGKAMSKMINSDPTMGNKRQLGLIKNYLMKLAVNNININEDNWNRNRDYKGFPSWDTAIARVGSVENLLSLLPNNHKIVNIEYINEDTEVFDLSIDTPYNDHNFALDAGVVVHNCDLAETAEAGLTILHKEYIVDSSGNRVVMLVTDLVLRIISPDRISLDAIEQFIIELARICNVQIAGLSADQFQSSQMRQKWDIERIMHKPDKYKPKLISVDRTPIPYGQLSNLVAHNALATGKSPLLRNQLKNIQKDSKGAIMTHIRKDMSDSLAGAAHSALMNPDDEPVYLFVSPDKLYNKNISTADIPEWEQI